MAKYMNNQSTINILNTLSQCSYPPNFRDFISNIILELSNSKGTQFFKVNKTRNNVVDTIIVVKYTVQTTFNFKLYEIPIVIYINKSFPYEAPEIYLERSQETGVNPKNLEIDPSTFRIITNGIRSWNQFSTIPNVIAEITNSFNKNFPIYKLAKKADAISNDLSMLSNTATNCDFNRISTNMNTNYNVYQQQNQYNYNNAINNANTGSVNTGYNNQYMTNTQTNQVNQTNLNTNVYVPNQVNQQGNINNKQTETPEEGIKRILIEEIMNNTEQKIKDEIKRIKQQEEKLKNYKNEFNSQIEKYQKVISNGDTIQNDFQNMLKTCDNEINSIKNYLTENSNKELNSKNFENFLQIANQKILRIVSIEATIDEFLAVVKKAFERQVLDFTEATKFIRVISREAMKIKFYRELLVKKL